MRINHAPVYVPLAVLLIVSSNAVPARAQAIASVSGGPSLVRSIGNHGSAWQVGAGAEVVGDLYGFGGEVQYIYFPEATTTFAGGLGEASSPAASTVTFAVKGSYYFPRMTARRVRPFVTAGLTYLYDDEEPLPMLHVGGGVDWWATRRTGMRFEVREHLGGILSFRCGFVFR
jgi:hypothetical protein